ncbi:MAG TPA: hypothetical protein VFW68_01410 [Rhodocyclaceae bacterium]|nr:hypothetical protein [Rhodocyclaceae bacterium]
MHCIYINADQQSSRSVFIRKSFEAYADPVWSLHRFSAVDANELPLRYWGGSLGREERARFASHEGALAMAVELPGDAMIMEDKVSFGPCSAEMIRHALDTARNGHWDLLFTDLCMIGPPDTESFFPEGDNQEVGLEDPRMVPWSGAMAYIVSESTKGRLLDYLKTLPLFNTPYHLVLRDLIEQEILSAHVTMPLAASPSCCGGSCPATCSHEH